MYSLTFRFLPHTNQPNYVYFKPDTVCRAANGMNAGRNVLSLVLDGSGDDCSRRGIIMHEIMHELGNYRNKTG